MSNTRSFAIVSGLLAFAAAGCSGGGSGSTSTLSIRCLGGQSFCIISCDLGCSQTGCSISEIAENQKLRFSFSDSVDPASVNNASISIRTVTGVPPDGEYLVSGREVAFIPRVRTVAGTTSFGFARNDTYIITLAGGPTAAQGVRSIAGDTLSEEFSCTVLASRGILDQDQLPPTCEMISPTNPTEAPVNPTIVLRFSELVDTTPLLGPLTVSSPMRVLLRLKTATGACDYDGDGTSLEGVPQVSTEIVGQGGSAHLVSVVTFQSPVQLPGNSCITVGITSDLRDISGRAAVPATFEILTVPGVSVPITITEPFQTSTPGPQTGFDPLISGGVWQDGARPGLVGGDGRHGSFNYQHGTQNPTTGEWEFNNNSFPIPANRSLTGLPYLIDDGKYYFTDFVVPENIKVRFTGSVPAQIYVRGQADIRGTIDVSGVEMPFRIPPVGESGAGQKVSTFDSRGLSTFVNGQGGGAPGCGGGRGGDGANECQGTGPGVGFPPPFDGKDGVDVRLPGGHAYGGSEIGTGGKGGVLNPASGLVVNTVLIATLYRAQFSQGGSGGGYMLPGGQSTGTPLPGVLFSPTSAPGAAFPLLPWPPAVPPPGYTALNHFLVGGSGGGGGGSSPYATFGFSSVATVPPNVYQAGHGGTGGGGAVAIRTGNSLVVANTGILRSKGGVAHLITGDAPGGTQDVNWGVSSPGGGGSGGSFLLQSSNGVTFQGTVDMGGGVGGRTGFISPASINQVSQAGSGALGFYHFQTPGGVVGFTGTATPAYNPAVNSSVLTDRDSASGCTSTWRSSGLIFPPTWLRYELDVDEDGNGTIETTYTDTGLPGTLKANDPNGPVVIVFQGTRLNQAGTEPLPGETVRPWRDGIGSGPLQGQGINVDTATGFRFMMTYNTGLFPNVVVRSLRVYART